MIKAGQKVLVYEDPITGKRFQGHAVILRVLKEAFTDHLFECRVRMVSDGVIRDVWIKDPDPDRG